VGCGLDLGVFGLGLKGRGLCGRGLGLGTCILVNITVIRSGAVAI